MNSSQDWSKNTFYKLNRNWKKKKMQETMKPNILMLLCAIGCLNIVTAKHLVSKRSAILNEGKSTGSVKMLYIREALKNIL